jgi:uncharacterized membrane protein
MSADFFQTYFIQPILQGGFFNPVNTAVLSIVLIIAIYGVYKLLVRFKIPIDFRFFIGLLPFFVWAASTRVLRDHTFNTALANAVQEGISRTQFITDLSLQFPRVLSESVAYVAQFEPAAIAQFHGWVIALFPTPGSYLITFVFALIALLIGIGLQNYAHISYWKVLCVIGLLAVAWNALIFIPLPNLGAFLPVVGTAVGITVVVYLLRYSKRLTPKLTGFAGIFTPVNLGIIFAHMLDASATFFSIAFYGYAEQHVLPRFVFEAFSPVWFFALKLIVLIPELYLIDRYSDERNFANFLKIVIFILGFAPGTRDVLRLMAFV